jgi:phage shock protein A
MNPIKWLLGASLYDRSSILTAASLSWLLGRPIERGGEIAVSAGDVALDRQEELIQQLADAVALQLNAVNTISNLLQENNEKVSSLTRNASSLVQNGEEDAALEVAIELESYEAQSPILKTNYEKAKASYESALSRLKDQQLKLKTMQVQQRSNKTTAQITAAMELANSKLRQIEGSSHNVFQTASDAISRRNTLAEATGEVQNELASSDNKIKRLTASSKLDRFRK